MLGGREVAKPNPLGAGIRTAVKGMHQVSSGITSHLAAAALRCQPDNRLVALGGEGHSQAVEELVRRYRPRLVAFARGIVGPDRSEDVVQEAFLKAQSVIDSGDAEFEIRPWLYTVVRNRALNTLRDERTHEQLDPDFDGVRQPPEIASERARLRSLLTAVDALPEGQREALVQRELEGRSHEEIATRLGSTPGAVRGLIFRARETLREACALLVPLPLVRALLERGDEFATGGATGGA